VTDHHMRWPARVKSPSRAIDHRQEILTPGLKTTGICRFWQRRGVRRLLFGLAAILAVTCYGTVGYLAMGWSLFDAFYQVVITISGVGFNEVRPISSTLIRLHTMTVIGLGVIAVAYTLGVFVQFLTESELHHYFGHHRMMNQNEILSGHTTVAGFGRVGGLVCDELATTARTFVIIELSHYETVVGIARRSGRLSLEHIDLLLADLR
jgi:voltage-gated potassium channel